MHGTLKERLNNFVVGLVMLAIGAVIAVAAWPTLVHLWDRGHQVMTLAQVSAGEKPSTHNLTIQGHPLMERRVRENSRELRNGTYEEGSARVSYYVPIVSENWTEAETVYVIARTEPTNIDDPDAMARMTEFSGTVRNEWSEGLDHEVLTLFTTRNRLHLSPNVIYIDLAPTPISTILMSIGGVVLALILGLGGLSGILRAIWPKSADNAS